MVLFPIFSWFWQWNKFEKWSTFDEGKAYKNGAKFLGYLVVYIRSIFTFYRFFQSNPSELV